MRVSKKKTANKNTKKTKKKVAEEQVEPESVEPMPMVVEPEIIEEVQSEVLTSAELPEVTLVAMNPNDVIEAKALVTMVCNIGSRKYILEEGKLVRHGVLRAHLKLLRGKVKQTSHAQK
jgi:hypothetical protein